ncbi:MAG: response regulator [Chloroflexi bacterium]|nr:response regulator [Chloroflexota bacterium]
MKKVLVVEDNESNLYLMRFLLEKNGFQVIEAKEGTQGVNMAKTETPDFIIMDIQLPDINGLEATRRIRDAEVNSNIPIIAVTSYAMVGDREKAIAAGCTGYIEKPINPDTFLAELKKYM